MLACLQGPALLLLLFPWSLYAPSPRLQVAYDAHEEHGVTPVEWGERCALTLWFTDVPEHCEDSRLLPQLAGGLRPSVAVGLGGGCCVVGALRGPQACQQGFQLAGQGWSCLTSSYAQQ